MSQVWLSKPRFKIELSSAATTITDDQAIEIQVVRPENNISHAIIVVNDYKSKNYVDNFDPFVDIDISFRYGTGTETKVFSGLINNVSPKIEKDKGEFLEIGAWGWEWGLSRTNCSTTFGTESANPAVNTPQLILNSIIESYVDDTFGSAPLDTHWDLGTAKVEDVHADFAITHLNGAYLDNFMLFGKLCDLVSAHAQDPLHAADVGIHWFVDTSKNVYVKRISQNSADGLWDHYWGGTSGTDPGTQASSTITVKQDIVLHDFRKTIDEYANFIVLASDFRKPAYDIWTEDGGPAWNNINSTDTYTAAQYVVGSHSLLLEPTGGGGWAYAYYPTVAGWDFTKCGSQNAIPHLNFYYRANVNAAFSSNILLCHDLAALGGGHADAYFACSPNDMMEPVLNKWVHLSLPIGPYYALDPSLQKVSGPSNFEWASVGGDWTEVNFICIAMANDATYDIYLDDLHFSGKLLRYAYDTSEITATKKEHQKVIYSPNALDDSLKASDDTGTAGRLAQAELYRRARANRAGVIQIPGAPTILPGQTVHMHASQQASGTYRINDDFRIKECRHIYDINGFRTQLNLTDDVTNSNAFGVPSLYGLLLEQAYGLTHGEARDLKSGNIILLPLSSVLSKAY